MNALKQNNLVKLIFFGNHFYGFCAIALSVEASLQQGYAIPSPLFMLMAYSATVLFYSKAYIVTEVSNDPANERAAWYARNSRLVNVTQIILTFILFVGGSYVLINRWENILSLTPNEWTMLGIFPLVSGLYYGIDHRLIGKFNLRNIGWLKPFIIGFSWAGMVNIYPMLFFHLNEGSHFYLSITDYFLFVKNLMFVTILCVLFDIKDYAMDYNAQLKTVVVNLGLRKTIYYFIIPLCLIGLASFWVVAFIRDFSIQKILINTIPFLLVISVAYTMYRRKSIFYYLVIIDGLMLVKAFCGSMAMLYF